MNDLIKLPAAHELLDCPAIGKVASDKRELRRQNFKVVNISRLQGRVVKIIQIIKRTDRMRVFEQALANV